jgi:hypothetical protein
MCSLCVHRSPLEFLLCMSQSQRQIKFFFVFFIEGKLFIFGRKVECRRALMSTRTIQRNINPAIAVTNKITLNEAKKAPY